MKHFGNKLSKSKPNIASKEISYLRKQTTKFGRLQMCLVRTVPPGKRRTLPTVVGDAAVQQWLPEAAVESGVGSQQAEVATVIRTGLFHLLRAK